MTSNALYISSLKHVLPAYQEGSPLFRSFSYPDFDSKNKYVATVEKPN